MTHARCPEGWHHDPRQGCIPSSPPPSCHLEGPQYYPVPADDGHWMCAACPPGHIYDSILGCVEKTPKFTAFLASDPTPPVHDPPCTDDEVLIDALGVCYRRCPHVCQYEGSTNTCHCPGKPPFPAPTAGEIAQAIQAGVWDPATNTTTTPTNVPDETPDQGPLRWGYIGLGVALLGLSVYAVTRKK